VKEEKNGIIWDMASKEIVLKEGVKKVEKIVKKDGDEVVGTVEAILKKLFLGIDVGVLEKRIEELKIKERAGALSKEDEKGLPKLLKIFEGRQVDIENKVEGLFKEVVEGGLLSEVQIINRAKTLLTEVDGTNVLTPVGKNKLAEIVKNGLVNARRVKDSAGATPEKKTAAEWVYAQLSNVEVQTSENRDERLIELKNVVIRITERYEGLTVEELSAKVRENQNNSPVNRKTEELLQLGDTNRDALKNKMNTRDGQIIEQIGRDAFKDDPIFKIIKGKIENRTELSPPERKILHEYNNQLIKFQLNLQNEFWEEAIDGVPGLNINQLGRTEFKIADIVVDKSYGTLKRRLKDAFRLVNFDAEEAGEIAEQKQFLLATGITQAQADQIWDNAAAWSEKYAEFSRGVVQLREESMAAEYGQKQKFVDEHRDVRNVPGESKQMKYHALIADYIDDKPVYTDEGRIRKQQLADMEAEMQFEKGPIDAEGRQTWRIKSESLEQRIKNFQKMSQKDLSVDQQAQMEKDRQEILEEMRVLDGEPEKQAQLLKDKIEESIYQIYDTGDASRAPGNQMASYRLYMYIGMLPGEADFKTQWMSRLAIYDVKMYMSGVENYEEWAKLNSFLPIEFRAFLHKDVMSIGKVLDQHGNEKELNLNFADLYSFYEEMDGSSDDSRDIWIARLLGAKDMSAVSLAKRQIMAAYLGKQMGIEFKYEMVGGQEMFRQVGSDTLRYNGKELSLLEMVGLDKDGLKLGESRRAEVGVDLRDQYGWYMDMPVDMGHLDLRWVGLERGGNKGDWWPQQLNGIRKLHGLSQVDYQKRKKMGMASATDMMDSGWRSLLAWKLFEKHTGVDKTVFWSPVEEKLGTIDSGRKGKFFDFMKQVVYLPEYWENGTTCGELRSIAEVRMLGGEEMDKVVAKYREFDSSNNFDWDPMLKLMGVEHGATINVKGEAGMKLLLQNFSLHRLISYEGIPHNMIADHIKYTGYSEKYWQASVPAGDFIWDMKTQKSLVEAMKSYYGMKGAEWKSKQLLQKQVRQGAMENLEGQETYMSTSGEETTELWKTTGAEDVAEAMRRGYRVDGSGYVVDKNNKYVYRPGKIGYWEGFGNPLGHWSRGSAAGRHGHPTTNWKTAKEILKGYLKSRMLTPEQYMQENKRFKYAMYFDTDIPWQEKPTMQGVLKLLREKPWKLAILPFTILRGIAVDLGLQPEDAVAFFSPLGKEVSSQFSKIF
jgi:hypothetical protein